MGRFRPQCQRVSGIQIHLVTGIGFLWFPFRTPYGLRDKKGNQRHEQKGAWIIPPGIYGTDGWWFTRNRPYIMINVTKNPSNSAIVSAGHNRLAELLQLPTKCRCNNLQNHFATTYKIFCKKYLQKQQQYNQKHNCYKTTLFFLTHAFVLTPPQGPE